MTTVPKLYTIAETAELLRVSQTQVRTLIRARELEAFDFSMGRCRAVKRVSHEALVRFIEQRKVGAA